jgi:hypothetical protein
MSEKQTTGPWSPLPPSLKGGGRTWCVTRLNTSACMNTEYLMAATKPRSFRSRNAAQKAADKANAALAKTKGATQ